MHILHSEASEQWGGQEIRTLMDAERAARAGHRVTILAKRGAALLARARAAGLSVAELPPGSPWAPSKVMAVARLIRARGVDVVHTHSSSDSWTAGLAARLTGRILVRTRHISAPMSHRVLGREVIKPVYLLPQAIICTSGAIRDALAGLGVSERRLHVLPSGVDLSRFRPREDAAALRAGLGLVGAPVITMLAMLRVEKGADVLLDAAARLLKDWPQALFVLAGGGDEPDIAALKRQAERLGVAASVRFLGHREDVPEILAASDVCVLPSSGNEGVPQAVIQYLAMARPVVATNVGGIPEAVEQGKCGLLVRPGDIDGLADAIAWLLRHPDEARRMGEAGQRVALERFDADRVAERVLAIYQELMGSRGLR